MEPGKAIKILTKWREEGSVDNEEELHEAEQLSIQALIFTQNVLKLMPIVFSLPLPSEIKG